MSIPLLDRASGNSSSESPLWDSDNNQRGVAHPSESDVSLDTQAEAPPSRTCIICHENQAVCVAFPCMHMSYCATCARSLCTENQKAKTKGSVNCGTYKSSWTQQWYRKIFLICIQTT
jgi:hypothetical protein